MTTTDPHALARYNTGVARATAANRADQHVAAGTCEKCQYRRVNKRNHRRCWGCMKENQA